MPTLTFSRFENRILTRIPCPTQRVLNCSSRCSPPLELRSRSIASRLARSRVGRRTRPIVARLAFWFWWWFDRLIFFCCCSSVVCVGVSLFCVEKRALFVSFGMKKKKKKKWWEKDKKKREAKKNFRNWWTNFILLTHVNTSHLVMFSLKRKKKAVVVGIAHRILLSSYYFLRSSKEAFSHLLRKKFKILKPSVDLLLSFSLFWNLINGTKTYVFANSRAR